MTIHTFFEQNILLMILFGTFMLGFIVKFGVAKSYRRLVVEAEGMAQSNHKLYKVILLKFEACFKLNLGVTNVDTFVDKYIYSYKTMGMYLYNWENIGNQFLVIIMITSVVGSILSVYYDCGQFAFFSTILSGFLLSGLLIFTDSLLNLSTKKHLLRLHIKDYLENVYRPRLENQEIQAEENRELKLSDLKLSELKPSELSDTDLYTSEDLENIEKEAQMLFRFSREEEEVIEEVLKEYMV